MLSIDSSNTVECGVDVQCVDCRARRHHLAGILLGELEDALDERRVLPLEDAHFLALLHENAKLVSGVHVLLGAHRRLPERAQHSIGGFVEQPGEWRRDPREDHERRHEPARDFLGMVEGGASRGELAENDVTIGDDRHRAHRADGGGTDPEGQRQGGV
jgi:hypothetical protein